MKKISKPFGKSKGEQGSETRFSPTKSEEETQIKGVRLAKFIALSSTLSRRQGEEAIATGRIMLNNTRVTSPVHWVYPQDRVCLDGQPLAPPEQLRLWCYYKPRKCLVTRTDPLGRRTIYDLMPLETSFRMVSVGRLDYDSEGLLLLTNVPTVAHHLEHPQTAWIRKYIVDVSSVPSPEVLEALEKGLILDDMEYRPIKIKVNKKISGFRNPLTFCLTEGKNREIRKVMEHFDIKVTRLLRVAYGPFILGSLQMGELAEVSSKSLCHSLKKEWLH